MILAYVPFFVGALLIHELGHLAAARACGVEVNEIGLGWGLKLAEFRWHNVNWAIRILPVGAYVRALRLNWAAERLAASRDSIAQIALQAGFYDQSHFSRTFKRQFGCTPLEYRTDAGR